MRIDGNDKENSQYFDAFVVGGGPAGSTTAYYLAKGGLRVMQAEKETFPADKICGDIVAPTVHETLQEMGVLQDFMQEGIGKWITSRGLVSPSGNSFVAEIGKSHDISVQRILLDDRMHNAVLRSGANCEQLDVISLTFPTEPNGYWTIHCKTPTGEENDFYSRYDGFSMFSV